EPVIQRRPALVRAPLGHMLAVFQHKLYRPAQFQINSWFGLELERPNLEGGGHPADRVALNKWRRAGVAIDHAHGGGPGGPVPRHLRRTLRTEHEDVEALARRRWFQAVHVHVGGRSRRAHGEYRAADTEWQRHQHREASQLPHTFPPNKETPNIISGNWLAAAV